MYKRGDLKNIIMVIVRNFPAEAQITRIEFEGPEIAVYVKNPAVIVNNPEIVKRIVKELKKRIVIRTDPEVRKSQHETREIIKSLVPSEAGIKDIQFDEVLGEVIVKAEKVGLVYGKNRNIYNKILVETGWRLNVVRAPPIESKTVNKVISHMLRQSSYRLNFLRSVGERIHRGVIYENRYVRITALGGFMEVGRSAILVETPESRVLLDVGINPAVVGTYDMYPRLDIDQLKLDELDAVIVTHAHLDHMGLVPYLFKYGYKGPVYATKPTRDLMVLSQLDLLDIIQRSGKTPPYTQHEVKKMVLHTIPLDYGEVTDIAPDIKLTFYNAGHILGSAIVHLHIGEGLHNIVYTGDFKYGKTRLLDKAHDSFPRVETLIMESTYGDTVLKSRREAEQELIEHISRTISRGGKVLIPVMAVGRAQEILLVVSDAIRRKWLPKINIYIDGMIDEVTAIHLSYPELLSSQLRERIFRGENPFVDDFIVKVKNRQMREDIAKGDEPCIILATSGMLQGGPSVEYLYMLAEDPKNMLIFVSYQVSGTLGRQIKDGAREITMVTPEGKLEVVKIRMEVVSVEGFSGHSDRKQLLAYIENIKPRPKNIILNHGEPSAIRSLANSIRKRYKNEFVVHTPAVLESILLSSTA
ncbi:MAG TPA: beta-CASP ribonuclease aCPSF1 [Pyrodictium sp.]|nr:beta-CASP ribonuclease aCPSF1 [Pyrodictium sp.]HIQ10484.1 beta-CASP ribonuclease aCPSF1 [Pyrodictium sp.]